VRHEAQLDAPVSAKDPKLGTVRAHLELLATRGNADAQARLDGPGAPDELRYLLALADEFSQGLRLGMNGLEASWVDLQAWSAMAGHVLESEEARAVLLIVQVRQHPGAAAEERAP
jgi:hypothetical protein